MDFASGCPLSADGVSWRHGGVGGASAYRRNAQRALGLPHLKRRAEYLRVARDGHVWSTHGLVLQMRRRDNSDDMTTDDAAARLGITVSRKVGNAVVRNRARRRLRAAADRILPTNALPGVDYVLIGRAETVRRPFALLVEDLERAIARLHAGGGRRSTSQRTRKPTGAVR